MRQSLTVINEARPKLLCLGQIGPIWDLALLRIGDWGTRCMLKTCPDREVSHELSYRLVGQ